jgi:hypothetical protein
LKRALFVLLAVAGLLLACTSTPGPHPLQVLPNTATLGHAADPDHFVFWVFGDNRPAKKDGPPTDTIQQIAAAMTTAQPALALSCGDLIAGKDPSDKKKIEKEYSEILAVLQATGVSVYNAPGNHEMDDKNDYPNSTMTQWYTEIIGPPFGSLTYGNSHFIALNTEEIPGPLAIRSPRSPLPLGDSLDPGYISPAQRDWLATDLAANKGAAHIFLFMHHSVHSFKSENQLDRDSANALVKILQPYPNVTAVFSAHEHIYYNPQAPTDLTDPMAGSTNGGPRYLVTGGAGAPLQSNDHGFYHYLIVTVDAGNVTIQQVKLP